MGHHNNDHSSMYNNGHGSGSGHDSMHHDQRTTTSMYNNGHGSGSGHDSMHHDQRTTTSMYNNGHGSGSGHNSMHGAEMVTPTAASGAARQPVKEEFKGKWAKMWKDALKKYDSDGDRRLT